MMSKKIDNLVKKVSQLVKFQEEPGGTTIADWITEGDTTGMTPADIAAEWDELSASNRDNG